MTGPGISLHPLALPPLPGHGRLAPGAVAVMDGRVFVARGAQIFVADIDATAWGLAFDSMLQAPTPEQSALAETLGLAPDAAGRLPGNHAIGPFARADNDSGAALYCTASGLWGGGVLRVVDDAGAVATGTPGLGDPMRIALTALTVFDGWLVAGTGSLAGRPPRGQPQPPEPDTPIEILATTDPDAGTWSAATLPGFGEDLTGGISALGTAHGHVYAARTDAKRGFELWRAQPTATLPWSWEKIIDRGGYGYSHTPRVTAMAEFGGDLYIAAGISETGWGPGPAGPAAAELFQIRADGHWDLIVGMPRFSPDGFKVPLAGQSPGFDDLGTTLITGLAVADGMLFAGTCRSPFEPAEERAKPSPLWMTRDGETWTSVQVGKETQQVRSTAAMCSHDGGLYMAVVTWPDTAATETVEIWRSHRDDARQPDM